MEPCAPWFDWKTVVTMMTMAKPQGQFLPPMG